MFNDIFSGQFEAKELHHGERSVNARHSLYAAMNHLTKKEQKNVYQ